MTGAFPEGAALRLAPHPTLSWRRRGAPPEDLGVDNLLLVSMLVATVAVPAVAARIPHGRRALKWTLLLLVAFTLAYAFLVRGWYATHAVPEPFQP